MALTGFRDRATELALAAGRTLMQHRASATATVEAKGRRRELVTAADRAAEHIVVGGLLASFPEHAVLAEEGVLTTQGIASKTADWTWIVDPLDGTTNFVHGLPLFAVAIALAFQQRPVVGVVHARARRDLRRRRGSRGAAPASGWIEKHGAGVQNRRCGGCPACHRLLLQPQ
jgi:myo-inositol-1(or 4)-monophosphatase